MTKRILTEEPDEQSAVSTVEPASIENDLARSAWFDSAFAVWFMPYAKRNVLFNGARGEEFFRDCGEFAKTHRAAPGSAGDAPEQILKSSGAIDWFRSFCFPVLPGGQTHKPTSWQMEKAQKYLRSRHNLLLAEQLTEAERIRADGDGVRADRLATDARRTFSSFADSVVPCKRAMSDVDAILSLAESNPPLFRVGGEMGRLLNPRLKPDNLGILLANQKVGKTTDLITLATIAAQQVPTLLIGTGDESELKYNARLITNISWKVTQPEFAGSFAVPVPDCAHNAAGTCPINMSGEPRQAKDWKRLIADGATPQDLAEGRADGSRAIGGGMYMPCCRCFPRNDGTREDAECRRHWKSAVWWRMEEFDLIDRKTLTEAKHRFERDSLGNGGLWVAA